MNAYLHASDGVMMPIDDSISLRHGGQFNGFFSGFIDALKSSETL